jgi:hypothetical protein
MRLTTIIPAATIAASTIVTSSRVEEVDVLEDRVCVLASRDREARRAAAVAFAFARACAVCLSGYDFQSRDGGCFSVFPASARTDGAATETPIATASRRALTGRRLIGS